MKCLMVGSSEGAIRILNAAGIDISRNPYLEPLDEEKLATLLSDCDASIAGSEPYTRRVMQMAPKLKIIARVGVGYDAIDLRAATERGVKVAIAPIPEAAKAIAELAFALILSSAKRIPSSNHTVRSRGWGVDPELGGVQDLYGKTIGLFGVGRIGQEVAKRARSFDMAVIYHDVVRRSDLEDSLGIRPVSFEDLVSQSDILSIHAPLTEATKNKFDASVISKMKKTAILVNTARGAIVDERALANALEAHRLDSAGVDAYSQEPPGSGHPFYDLGESRLRNLILTPHMGMGRETVNALTDEAAREVVRGLTGDGPLHPVNPHS